MANDLLASDPARIDAEWMTRALRRAGVPGSARVVDIARKPVGNGLVADSYRFTLTYVLLSRTGGDGGDPHPAGVRGRNRPGDG